MPTGRGGKSSGVNLQLAPALVSKFNGRAGDSTEFVENRLQGDRVSRRRHAFLVAEPVADTGGERRSFHLLESC